jgi:plasmid stabilization system protein ParE
MVVIWTPHAERKLDDVHSYYVEHNPQAAKRMVAGIVHASNSLKVFPKRAPLLLVYRKKRFRELLVQRPHRKIHKLIYYIEDKTVYIATVWDCRQNPQKLIDELKNLYIK